MPNTDELKASHLAQIEALTKPGLSDEERVREFGKAAGFDDYERSVAAAFLTGGCSPAKAVWFVSAPQRSIFGKLPGRENVSCHHELFSGLPKMVDYPDADALQRFSEIQIETRTD